MTNPDGTIEPDSHQGLFDHDTRVLSRYQIRLDDQSPGVDSTGLVDASHWIARLTVPRPGGDPEGPRLPQDSLELTLDRRLANGMAEEITVQNHSAAPTRTAFSLCIEADFRDILDLDNPHPLRGRTRRHWDIEHRTFTIDWHASHDDRTVHRGIRLRVIRSDSPPQMKAWMLRFPLDLAARGSWTASLVYEVLVDDRWRSPMDAAVLSARRDAAATWQRDRATVESDPPAFATAVERAADDLLALRNWELDVAADAWVPNAGLPTYTGLFGRDVLTTGWQSGLLGPEIMRGAVGRIAATQADVDSAWRDEEPGKMVHEMRRGPLSDLNITPQRRYYGGQTASSFFIITLAELWHWTGDADVLRAYLEPALRALAWADSRADPDGFLEYKTRSSRGLKNQGWKDSDEAIRYPDGSLVEDPIATVEEQAFHCVALRRMAEILTALGDDERAARFLDRSRQLQVTWHDAFWMNDEGFYAMALDPDKRQVRSIASNPGHALATGLVPVEYARRVADRLMAADLFSGWGIRTLSSEHPSYNPLAYHLGAVWPVENATIALGLKRYGFDDYVERLGTALFDAADCFRYSRLPEALGGHGRQEAPIPTVYPASNSPQAWSASAIIQMAQTFLGIYPFAPAYVLALVRPALPAWLRTVTVRNLRVGTARASIRFERMRDGSTVYDVFEKSGPLYVLDALPPQARDQSWKETITAWILDHAPGRPVAALRIAIGD